MERWTAMALSVTNAALGRGMAPSEVEILGRAHALAMEPRLAAIDDDHHPAYLHPGRTVLVLLQDVGTVSVTALCAAAVHESEDRHLRLGSESVRGALGDDVADVVDALPLAGDPRLLERLVTLEPEPLLAALAERLDHLRHAHLREDHEWWRVIHEEARCVWVPVAERAHPKLAGRYRHWQRTFGRRLDARAEP